MGTRFGPQHGPDCPICAGEFRFDAAIIFLALVLLGLGWAAAHYLL